MTQSKSSLPLSDEEVFVNAHGWKDEPSIPTNDVILMLRAYRYESKLPVGTEGEK